MKLSVKHTAVACCIAYVSQAAVINLAPLFYTIMQNGYGVSLSELASLVLVMFITQIFVDIASVKLVDGIGYRLSALIACALMSAGLIMMGILPRIPGFAYPGLFISVIVASVGGGVVDCIANPIVESLSETGKASHLSLLHSCYSWGHVLVIALTTLTLYVIGQGNWYFIPMAWALLSIVNFVMFIFVPLTETKQSEDGTSPKKLLFSKSFLVFAFIILCGGASEQVIAQWSSLFAETGLGVPKVIGDLLGPCLFALFMAIGRTAYGVAGKKLKLKKAMLLCSCATIFCYLLTVFGSNAVFSLAGCALSGFGVSLMWPGTISMTSEHIHGGTAMFGLCAFFGDIGCSLGPWLTGVVSDKVISSETCLTAADKLGISAEELGLKSGILAGVLFPAAMIILILVSDRVLKKNKNHSSPGDSKCINQGK